MKILSVRKTFFLAVRKTKFWLENKFVRWKKMSVEEFPLPKTDMSGMCGIPWNARPKTGRGGKKRPRAYRGVKKEKKFVIWNKTVFCWLEKQNVGWKTKCRLENFPCQKWTCPECLEFPGMEDWKTAEAENSPLGPRGKKGVRWNIKILSVRKIFFLSVGKKNVGWIFFSRL